MRMPASFRCRQSKSFGHFSITSAAPCFLSTRTSAMPTTKLSPLRNPAPWSKRHRIENVSAPPGLECQSRPGGALTFSILWRFDQGAGFLSGLSLVVGIALVRVLRKHGAADVMLKWPNDLLWRHLKLAGILIELAGDVMGPTVAVIGVGINLRLPDSVKARIDQPVVDLAKIGVAQDRNDLFAEILGELDSTLRTFSADGFAPFREEWDRLHAYQDKMVRVRMPDKSEMEGRVQGVGDDGALQLHTRSGARKLYGGEMSLRGAA